MYESSVHEMGRYDVPAVIDHILHVTQQPALYYVGFSWGNQIFFISMSLKPEYNSKIRLMVALAPAVFLHDSPSGSNYVAPSLQRILVTMKRSSIQLKLQFQPKTKVSDVHVY